MNQTLESVITVTHGDITKFGRRDAYLGWLLFIDSIQMNALDFILLIFHYRYEESHT